MATAREGRGRVKRPKPVTIDFETEKIQQRPLYPPRPVSVSIKYHGKKPKFYAWGHPTENTCSFEEARAAVLQAFEHEDGICCQNGKFDVDVAEVFMGTPRLHWSKYHDSMFLIFLHNPHAKTYSLKPTAEALLDMPPEEQDELADWLVANQPVPGIRISRSPQGKHPYGAYIAYAPGKLVGKYCDGDVIRTEKLFDLLYDEAAERGMLEAYQREQRLMPYLLEAERNGVPVDRERLSNDCQMYRIALDKIDAYLRKALKVDEINIDSGAQLMQALLNAGLADAEAIEYTDKGAIKFDKETLAACVNDPMILGLLKYRTQLGTCLGTFMEPWLNMAENSNGFIYTSWNQLRSSERGYNAGTRTGRMSSTPNFQNIPKEFSPIFKHDTTEAKLKKTLAKAPFALPPLPLVRSYVVPLNNEHILIDRDYSQQELRILGHFEGGLLMDAYNENPWLDLHDYAKDLINNLLGTNFERKPIKNTGFGLIYGMGVGKLAIKSNIDVTQAKQVKDAYLTTFPGLKEINRDMKQRALAEQPIRTWGGREYFCEPPAMINGKRCTFEYKMLNVLIQGSAADCTKEAYIRYMDAKPKEHKLFLTVHDEFLGSVPTNELARGMALLREAMESVQFDVPMLSDGKASLENWASLKKYDKEGVIVYGA